jgi:transcriptional regulator with XRE-family HTH domain
MANSVSGADLVARIGSQINEKGLKRTDLYKIVPSGTLSNWKKKDQEPSAYTLYEISVFLGTSVDFLLTGKSPDGLTEDELCLLRDYRDIEQDDRDEIVALIGYKLEKRKKGDTISNSAHA